jgi:signal transduction histidine kinase
MRLAPKIFAALAAVLLALGAVAGWSLAALHRLVAANRDIVTRAVPAARLEHELPEAMSRLLRLEARYLVLRDRALAALWRERAARAGQDLERLGGLLGTERERQRHAAVTAAFGRYRAEAERAFALAARGDLAGAQRVSEREARPAARRAEHVLGELMAATGTALAASLDEVAGLERRTWRAVVAALGAAVTVGLAASGILALRLTRSLRRLAAATREVPAGRPEPLPVTGGDEIADLTRAFNQMAERLRELDRLKEEFFSHISHDLRNPLTALRGAVQLMRSGRSGPLSEKQEKILGVLEVSSSRMLGLLNQILELTRLRAGCLPLEMRPLDLGDIAARAVDELAPQAETQGVTLALAGRTGPLPVTGDEGALLRVVVNLASNAITFTPAGGRVTVGLAAGGGGVELRVEDTGAGIPPEALARVFEPYQQAHRGRGGSGLGLAVVKGLVDAHGGTVRVESEPGRGSVFTVRLPAGPAPSRPARPAGAPPAVVLGGLALPPPAARAKVPA